LLIYSSKAHAQMCFFYTKAYLFKVVYVAKISIICFKHSLFELVRF
jgi:hypothetical protein